MAKNSKERRGLPPCPVPAVGGPENKDSFFRSGTEKRGAWYLGPRPRQGSERIATKGSHQGLVGLLHSLNQDKGNGIGWPIFNLKYVNYLRFKKEWWEYWQTYNGLVGDELVARILRDQCASSDAKAIIDNVEGLDKIWRILETCYRRPENNESLKLILSFR
jgi:hypothetical protein